MDPTLITDHERKILKGKEAYYTTSHGKMHPLIELKNKTFKTLRLEGTEFKTSANELRIHVNQEKYALDNNRMLIFISNSFEHVFPIEVQDQSFIMIQEAKLIGSKDWQPIQYWSYSWCGNSYSNFDLPARTYITTIAKKYTGPIKVKIRFRLKTKNMIVLSETFDSTIKKKELIKYRSKGINFLN